MASKKKCKEEEEDLLENWKLERGLKDTIAAKLCERISNKSARDMHADLTLARASENGEDSKFVDLILEKRELERKAEMQLLTMIELAEKGNYQNPAPYSNGDQTPLTGHKSKILKKQWAGGMDYNPDNPRFSHWMRVLYYGDFPAVKKIIQQTKKQDLQNLLEKRESFYNISAIFHVIMGARVLFANRQELAGRQQRFKNRKSDHMSIFEYLLDLGANINAKDVAGNTPLHHCVTMFANDVTKKMAEILLDKGANVNDQNRFGETPLNEPTITGQLDTLELLVKYGANPSIPDNDGTTCLGYHKWGYPKIEKIFAKASHDQAKDKRRQAREEQGGCLWKCVGCGSKKKENKRCTGCYLVYYCGRPCQEEDWSNHKKACKETKKKYVPVTITRLDQMLCQPHQTEKVFVCRKDDVPSTRHFMLKIQVPIGGLEEVKGDLKVYNKDRSFWGFIPPTDVSYEKLAEKIKEEGPLGAKGYFYAVWDESTGVKINTSDIQAPQIW